MLINSQTFGSNAQSHHQLLPANANNNPFNLQNHFRGNSNSQEAGGFHREVSPTPYATSSPFIPRRQPHRLPSQTNNQQYHQPQQETYQQSSILDKITFANAPTTQQSPPELNSYYNHLHSGISTPPTTSFPGQSQPSAKLFNFLNQPFQFFQNGFNRFSQNQQEQQQSNVQTPPQPSQQSIIPQAPTEIPVQPNEQNQQQYFYNYFSRPNQQHVPYQGTTNNKEQQETYVNPGVNYNAPPVKDGSNRQSYLINQYFSTKTTQGPPTSYTFTIGADPTTGPTATVRVNVGGPKDALPPPPKLSFPNHQRLIPIRQYESTDIIEEDNDSSLPENNQVSQNTPDSPLTYQSPPESPEITQESDYEDPEPLTTTGKPVIMVITNRRTTTEDSQTIITTSSTTTPVPTSTTALPTEQPTTTTSPSTTSTTEMPSPSTTTTTTQAPQTTTTSLAPTTSTTTSTPKPPVIKQRKVIRKKVPRRRFPSHGKNRIVSPSEEKVPSPPAPEQEQVGEQLAPEISPITTSTRSPGRRRTSQTPFHITTRKLRLRITTTPPSTTTTTSTTPRPEELEVATTTAPPSRQVYTTTTPPTRYYTTTTAAGVTGRVNYSPATPTSTPEEDVEATVAPVFTTTEEIILPHSFYSRHPEPESLQDDEQTSSASTTQPPRIYNEESKSQSRTTESPSFIEGDIDDDTVAVGTPSSPLEVSTEEHPTTTTVRPITTFSPSESSSTEQSTEALSHSNGQSNASPDVNYPEYDEYYEYEDTPGHTEASTSTSSPVTTTSTSSTTTTTGSYRRKGDSRQQESTTTSPETFATTFTSRTRSSTTPDESLIEDHDEYVRTESPSSSTTSLYRDEPADSSGVPISSTEATTEPILFSEDEIIEPLSTTETPVSSSTQSNTDSSDDIRTTEESTDNFNGISTTASTSLSSSTEKSENTTGGLSELASSTEVNSSKRDGKAIESQDPVSEEAPVPDYKDVPSINAEAGSGPFYETPVRDLPESSPTGPLSSESPQQNYDQDFPDQDEYNYPVQEFDPYEDERIAEAKKLSLKAALQNIRNRQNATSTTTDKPLNETSTEKKFIRRPVPVRTFSTSSSSSSSTGNTYDDEELGEDSRSQVIQKIQSFRTKLRKVSTSVVRASTTKRPRRVTRPSSKSTSTENPGDLSQNENDIRGNGKDELDNEVSRHPKVISGRKKQPDELVGEEISSDNVVSLPGGVETSKKSSESVKDTIRNDGNDDSPSEPKPNQLEFEEVSSTTSTTSTTKPTSSDEPSSTLKSAVTHVGELIIHEILPTTSTTSTTEETLQDQSDLDFDTGSVEETGQVQEHSTSISVAVSSEFEDDDEPSSTTTTTTTTALPITTRRSRVKVIRVRGKLVSSPESSTTTSTTTTTVATPITTAPTTEATTTSSTELVTSSSTTEESIQTLVATEVTFEANGGGDVSQESSSPVPQQKKVKVILKRRKGAPRGKATVARQVVRTRSRKPKVTEPAAP